MEYFNSPDFAPWGALDAAAFEAEFHRLKKTLSTLPGLERLLERYIIAHLLNDGGRAPSWALDFARRHIDLQNHFPGISWETLAAGRWAMFPVAMAREDRRKCQYFMAGSLRGASNTALLPAWARKLLDDAACRALDDAAAAAVSRCPMPQDGSLLVFPLARALPRDDGRLRGSSLGLPAALAFMKVISGEAVAMRHLATGTITASGTVGSVANLPEKMCLAVEAERCALFLYPEENGPLSGVKAIDALPVADLDEAWGAVLRHAPGNGAELLMFARMTKDAAAFVAGMARVNSAWIRYEADRGRLDGVVRNVTAAPRLFAKYVEEVDRLLESWALDDAALFLDLIPDSALEAAARRSPLSAFRLHTQRIALSNHRGDTASAQAWAARAETLLPQALRGDLELCADFINNRFVTRHNQYRFDPRLPEDVSRILEILEGRYAVACEGGCPTDPVLARLCGTIAQNFAFCGPAFLEETTAYARKSMAAFGGGAVPEFLDDMLRQQGCLFYAFLDAGDYARAENRLMAFIAADGWGDVMEKCRAGRMSPWHHAALARFLADAGPPEICLEYLDHCSEGAPVFNDTHHPRQLWAFNLGRIAAALNHDTAIRWFQQSLTLCLDKEKQPTIHTMALLPFSGLWRLGSLDESCTAQLISTVIQSAVELNGSYFHQLLDSSRDQLFENIWERPQALFPFTYR